MKRVIPVLVALGLIILIGGIAIGGIVKDKYSYSKERITPEEYFDMTPGQLTMILQDDRVEEKAMLRDNVCYFDLDTVQKYFNDTFYADVNEGILLYTTAQETVRMAFGSSSVQSVSFEGGEKNFAYPLCLAEGDRIYLAADLVKLFTNCSIEVFDGRVQVYTQWGTRTVDILKKDTQLRLKGGIKSPILCDLTAGDKVKILEQMETWSKVKTADAYIGYVENKYLENLSSGQGVAEEEVPVTDYQEPEYPSFQIDSKVCLGWHAIGGTGGNATLEDTVRGTKGMNVIAPTWFSLNDEEGNFRSFAEKSYVDRAHKLGLKVWGVLDDFNYRLETGTELSMYAILSRTSVRQKLASSIAQTAAELGLDGVNLDFEKVTEDCGEHYAQFIRELSLECHNRGLTLSIDNYVPYEYRSYYRLDVQGKAADYVIIMGYDEHWHGSGNPGSVASIGYVKDGISAGLKKVPASKLMNALPFYTILWKTEGTKVTDEYITLVNVKDFLSRANVTPQWDEETCQNYAKWTSGEATYQIWVEDEESIVAKLSVMTASDLAGVAVWRLGYGNEAVWNLIQGYMQ